VYRNRDIRRAHETLDTFIHAQVADHKMEVRSGASPRNDVLSMLVRANKEDGGKLSLNDTELVSRLSGVWHCW
jgi:cytochrome P450